MRRMTYIFALLLLALTAHGQQYRRVAILNTEDDGDSQMEVSDLNYLTVRLREIAVKILPKDNYSIMTAQSIIDMLGKDDARKVCKEAQCLAEIGRKVSADYVGQARLGRLGGNLTISMELYHSASGSLVDSFTGNAKDIFGLLAVLNENAPPMFGKMPDVIYIPEPKSTPVPGDEVPKSEKPVKTSFWVAIGLDVLGVALISYAIYENGEAKDAFDRYSEKGQQQNYYDAEWKKVEDSRSSRNMFYIIGGAILASGIGVHIWF
ncbi:MAG: hypothetical protein LBC64_08970 [Fibromonadaceae bacterium]|nr:hypothetical protein [Fibromonadaceae bacterium]